MSRLKSCEEGGKSCEERVKSCQQGGMRATMSRGGQELSRECKAGSKHMSRGCQEGVKRVANRWE